MPQEQIGLKKISGFGIVAAFGLITMSSNMVNNSLTTINAKPVYFYESPSYFYRGNKVCNSSMLSRQVVGDILSIAKKSDLIQQQEKIKVNLQITKISKHVSDFDFEDEYEEI